MYFFKYFQYLFKNSKNALSCDANNENTQSIILCVCSLVTCVDLCPQDEEWLEQTEVVEDLEGIKVTPLGQE